MQFFFRGLLVAAITYFLKLGHNNHGLIFTVVTLGLLRAVETVGLLWAVETVGLLWAEETMGLLRAVETMGLLRAVDTMVMGNVAENKKFLRFHQDQSMSSSSNERKECIYIPL